MENKNKNLLIGGLLSAVFVMAIAFAGFSQQLQITDSAASTTTWNIGFSSATPSVACSGTPTAACGTVTSFTTGATSISFQTKLFSPGETVTYTVKVKNSGNVTAKLTGLTLNEGNTSNLIQYSQSGLTQNSTTVAANQEVQFTVTVTFKQTSGSVAAQSDSLTLNLTWEQA